MRSYSQLCDAAATMAASYLAGEIAKCWTTLADLQPQEAALATLLVGEILNPIDLDEFQTWLRGAMAQPESQLPINLGQQVTNVYNVGEPGRGFAPAGSVGTVYAAGHQQVYVRFWDNQEPVYYTCPWSEFDTCLKRTGGR